MPERGLSARPGCLPSRFHVSSTCSPYVVMFSRVYSELGGRRGREGGWAWRGVISSAARKTRPTGLMSPRHRRDDDISISKIRRKDTHDKITTTRRSPPKPHRTRSRPEALATTDVASFALGDKKKRNCVFDFRGRGDRRNDCGVARLPLPLVTTASSPAHDDASHLGRAHDDASHLPTTASSPAHDGASPLQRHRRSGRAASPTE
jgi:hypothetical protein